MFQIRAIGGYGEVGRNCTAIRVDDDVVILDMGLKMDEYVAHTEDEDYVNISGKKLIEVGAAPDISVLDDWKKLTKAIILGHAHLDHIGAVPYLANRFKAPIYGTPFTIAVLRSIIKDRSAWFRNELIAKPVGSRIKISDKITVEFINMTHSVQETISILVETSYGKILYTNDFKIDNEPTMGNSFSSEKLKKIYPDVLIVDSLYANRESRTPSESTAKKMLRDLFQNTDFKGKAIFITTFSSHIARLKTIVECAKSIKRNIVFLGRSLFKYVDAAKEAGIGKDFENIQIVKYSSKIRNFFSGIPYPEKYVFVVTGHQGEPKAVLSKILGYFPFKPEDVVIFSCTTIPTEITEKHRKILEERLLEKKLNIYKDVHVSGHASKEDVRDFIKLISPKKIISSHAEEHQMNALKEIALELGYDEKDILLIHNRETIDLG